MDDSIVELKRRARRAAILDLIRRGGTVTRGDLARRMRLKIPTITHLVAGLMAEGLVREEGRHEAGRGRKSARLVVDPDASFVAGLWACSSGVMGAVVNLGGMPSQPARLQGAPKPDTLAERLQQVLARAAENAAVPLERLQGVGIGLEGYPTETTPAVSEKLGASLGVPVQVAADVDAATLGEGWFSEADSVLLVHFGDTIRSGLVTSGVIHRGAVSGLGLGQAVLEDREGSGTLQSLASGGAICEAVCREVGRGIRTKLPDLVGGDLSRLTLRIVTGAAEAGDILAFNVLDRAGRSIGSALAWAVCAVNPERLVLAGDLIRAGGPLTDAIRHEVSSRVPRGWDVESRLVLAASDEETFLRGAAALAVRRLFGRDNDMALCV